MNRIEEIYSLVASLSRADQPEPDLEQALFGSMLEQTQIEIRAQVANGQVPSNVSDFSELHEYCDANCYAGLGEDAVFEGLAKYFAQGQPIDGVPEGMAESYSCPPPSRTKCNSCWR